MLKLLVIVAWWCTTTIVALFHLDFAFPFVTARNIIRIYLA